MPLVLLASIFIVWAFDGCKALNCDARDGKREYGFDIAARIKAVDWNMERISARQR